MPVMRLSLKLRSLSSALAVFFSSQAMPSIEGAAAAEIAKERRMQPIQEITLTGGGQSRRITLSEAALMAAALSRALADTDLIARSGIPAELRARLHNSSGMAEISNGDLRSGFWLANIDRDGLRWEYRLSLPTAPRTVGLMLLAPLVPGESGWRVETIGLQKIFGR